jgi:hypothetical protein
MLLTDEILYYVPSYRCEPFVGEECVVFGVDPPCVVVLSCHSRQVLQGCVGAKTLDAHRRHILVAGALEDPSRIGPSLRELVAQGLLRRLDMCNLAALSSSTKHFVPGNLTIGIPTADRPRALKRCLSSLLLHLERFGEAPQVLIVDGSKQASNEHANRQVVRDFKKKTMIPITFIGTLEITEISGFVISRGFDPAVVRFALSGGFTGANRNVITLSTVGRKLLMVDDDVLVHPWCSDSADSGLAVYGHDPQEEVNVYSAYASAVAELRQADRSLTRAHEEVLGQTMQELASRHFPNVQLGSACPHLLDAIYSGVETSVGMSFSGIAGDSGSSCSYRTLLSSAPLQRLIEWHPELLPVALASRSIKRGVPRLTINHDTYCMTYCTGFDNRTFMPPFMPAGRNQDGVMGHIMKYCFPDAVSAHLPLGILHDSGRGNFEPCEIPRVRARLCDYLIHLVVQARAVHGPVGAEHRLINLGRVSNQVATAGGQAFKDYLLQAVLEGSLLQSRRAFPGGHGMGATACKDELGQMYRASFIEAARNKSFWFPEELDAGLSDVDQAEKFLRRFLRDFGSLLVCWPEMRAVMRESGFVTT